MVDEYARAQLIFLDEIARRNKEAADSLRENPESVRQIIEVAVVALRESVMAGTSAVAEAIRSAPVPESIVGPVASVANAVVMQGNRHTDLLAAVVEAVRSIPPAPAAEAPVKKWNVNIDRNFETGLIQGVTIEAIE